MKSLCQDCQCPCQGSNLGSSEYKSGVLRHGRSHSVSMAEDLSIVAPRLPDQHCILESRTVNTRCVEGSYFITSDVI